MKKNLLCLVVLLFNLLIVFQQTMGQTYPSLYGDQKILGGSNATITISNAISKTSDDNYIVGANIGDDMWMIKIDGTTGDTIWTTRPLGGTGNDAGGSTYEAPDGNYIMTGSTNSTNGDVIGFHPGCGFCYDIWVVKIDSSNGDLIWASKALGGTDSELGFNAFVTSDGNFFMLASSSSTDGDVRGLHGTAADLWGIKLNLTTGDTIWTSRALGGTNLEFPKYGMESSDGNYILGGSSASPDGDVRGQHGGVCGFLSCTDYWIVKLNALTGDTIWTSRGIGGTGNDKAIFVNEATDNSILVSGSTTSFDGDVRGQHGGPCFGGCRDYWSVKLDPNNGDTLATSIALGGSGDEIPGYSLNTADNNFIISGSTQSSDGDVRQQHGGNDLWIVKMNSLTLDTIKTSRAFGGTGSDFLVQGVNACNDGFIFSGSSTTVIADGDINLSGPAGTTSLLWAAKINENLDLEWNRTWSDGTTEQSAHQVVTANDGGYLYIGKANEPLLNGDKKISGLGIWIAKFYWLEASFITDTVCLGNPTIFIDSSKGTTNAQPGIIWNWDFGDGFGSSTQSPSHTYPVDGTFTGRLIVQKECQADTFIGFVSVLPPGQSVNLGNDTLFCTGDSLEIDAGLGWIDYVWSTGDSSQTILINDSGLYIVSTTDNVGCQDIDSLVVKTESFPMVIANPKDTTICASNNIKLVASGGDNYIWSNDTEQFNTSSINLFPNSNATYFAIVSNICGSDTAISNIIVNDCFFVPNAFSPNQDGYNDLFIANGLVAKTYQLEIFNRWGNIVFKSHNINEGWDGTNQSKANAKAENGVYIYQITGEFVDDSPIDLKGNITLIR